MVFRPMPVLRCINLLFNTASASGKRISGNSSGRGWGRTGQLSYPQDRRGDYFSEQSTGLVDRDQGPGCSAKGWQINPAAGKLTGVSTYKGSLEIRKPPILISPFQFWILRAKTAEELGKYIFDISAASYKGNDIRVCSIGGVYTGQGGWTFLYQKCSGLNNLVIQYHRIVL